MSKKTKDQIEKEMAVTQSKYDELQRQVNGLEGNVNSKQNRINQLERANTELVKQIAAVRSIIEARLFSNHDVGVNPKQNWEGQAAEVTNEEIRFLRHLYGITTDIPF